MADVVVTYKMVEDGDSVKKSADKFAKRVSDGLGGSGSGSGDSNSNTKRTQNILNRMAISVAAGNLISKGIEVMLGGIIELFEPFVKLLKIIFLLFFMPIFKLLLPILMPLLKLALKGASFVSETGGQGGTAVGGAIAGVGGEIFNALVGIKETLITAWDNLSKIGSNIFKIDILKAAFDLAILPIKIFFSLMGINFDNFVKKDLPKIVEGVSKFITTFVSAMGKTVSWLVDTFWYGMALIGDNVIKMVNGIITMLKGIKLPTFSIKFNPLPYIVWSTFSPFAGAQPIQAPPAISSTISKYEDKYAPTTPQSTTNLIFNITGTATKDQAKNILDELLRLEARRKITQNGYAGSLIS